MFHTQPTGELLIVYLIHFVSFSFRTRSIAIGQCVIVHNVCTGAICDGSSPDVKKCGCIVAPHSKQHALRFQLQADEFFQERAEIDSMSCQSQKYMQYIVHPKTSFKRPIDNCQIDKNAEKIVAKHLQDEESFLQVVGWCGSPVSDSDLVKDALIIHVVSIELVPLLENTVASERYSNEFDSKGDNSCDEVKLD